MSKIVRYEFDLDNLPPLTDADRAQLKKLADMPDSDIDLSDIPELTEEFWKNAVRGRFYKPTKQAATMPIEPKDTAQTQRLGFMLGECQAPENFDAMRSDEIQALFEG